MARLRLGTKSFALPQSRVLRVALGIALVCGGLLGFLPIVGFWMIPLGLVVLAEDFPVVRRWNRRLSVAVKRWWTGRKAPRAARVEPGTP